MSQNSHTLLLFFEDNDSLKNCLSMLNSLESGDEEKIKEYSDQLHLDISHIWNEEWANHVLEPRNDHISLYYDTATSYELPTDVLVKLSDAGLKASCLEVSYGQVGEYSQFYFTKTHLVEVDNFFEKFPELKQTISNEFELDPSELEDDGYSRPATIKTLITERERELKETEEMMDRIKNMSNSSNKDGVSLGEFLTSPAFLRGLGKALLHASIFGLITAWLFKGIWLWIGLSIVLAVILSIVYFDDRAFWLEQNEADSKLESEKK